MDVILAAALWPWVSLSLQQKWAPGDFLGIKGDWLLRKADILTAICETTV
jgi:hypothetical protein